MNHTQQQQHPFFISMAPKFVALVLVAAMACCFLAKASDPSILSDFISPDGTVVDANFFTFNGTGNVLFQNPRVFKVTKASLAEFPAKIGQSVSLAILQFPGGSVNPPHTHPRSAEFLFVIKGRLEVGFVDSSNKLFTAKLRVGDSFLFPKGLVHFQFNPDIGNLAIAISGFGSADAGTVSIPSTVFTSGIDDAVLAQSFKTDIPTIQKIKAALAVKT